LLGDHFQTMKMIPLDDAIRMLESCSAVIVDTYTVTYPALSIEDEVFLTLEVYGSNVEFEAKDNERVRFHGSRLWLTASGDAAPTEIQLLVPMFQSIACFNENQIHVRCGPLRRGLCQRQVRG
jgi:hypothetical protein